MVNRVLKTLYSYNAIMLFTTKKLYEIVGLCCHLIFDKIVQDVQYGNNS